MTFKIGDTFRRHGQQFEIAGFRPHVTRRGKPIELVEVLSRCNVCDKWYGATTTRSGVRGLKGYTVTRTCSLHRGLGPRWRKPPPLIDAIPAALAERPGAFMSVADLAKACGRAEPSIRGALNKAFKSARGDVIMLTKGRIFRRRGGGLPQLYMLLSRGTSRSAKAERDALAMYNRAHGSPREQAQAIRELGL